MPWILGWLFRAGDLGKSVHDAARYVAGLPASACSPVDTTYWARIAVYANWPILVPCDSPRNLRPLVLLLLFFWFQLRHCDATFSYNSIILTGAIAGIFPGISKHIQLVRSASGGSSWRVNCCATLRARSSWSTRLYFPYSSYWYLEPLMSPTCCLSGPWRTRPLTWAHARLCRRCGC